MENAKFATIGVSVLVLCSVSASVFAGGISGLLLSDKQELLDVAMIDWNACKGYENISNILVGDFNADGVLDLAALLVSDTKKEPVKWKEELVLEKSLELTALVSQSGGGYRRLVLERLPTFMPTNIALRYSQPSDWEKTGIDQVDQSRDYIVRVYCERSEVIYSWNNDGFVLHPLSY